jgi:hypothetical protein
MVYLGKIFSLARGEAFVVGSQITLKSRGENGDSLNFTVSSHLQGFVQLLQIDRAERDA